MKASKQHMKTYLLLTMLLAVIALPAQIQRGVLPEKPVILLNGTLHIGNGEVMENAAVGFENGVITMVADARVIRVDATAAEVIDVTGQHIYPGFIAANTQLGLAEIELVRATLDYEEVGEFTPHVRSIIAYNTDSKIIPTVRANGVLMAQVVPQGGRISGSSSVVQLDAWNWEDAIVAADKGIHLYWAALFRRSGWWAEQAGVQQNEQWRKDLQELIDFLDAARAYHGAGSPQPFSQVLAAMKPLFTGEARLYIHVDQVQDMRQAAELLQRYGLSGVFVGARDAWMIPDVLADAGVQVILRSTHNLPGYADDAVDLPYKTPYLLQQAGIPFCISVEGSWQVRNLPFAAGTAAAYGLSGEEAIQAITGTAAAILGVDDHYGTVEEGKKATLFVSAGDALDMRTNRVTHAFIDGRRIDLTTHQEQLYELYRQKYGLDQAGQ